MRCPEASRRGHGAGPIVCLAAIGTADAGTFMVKRYRLVLPGEE